MTRKKRVGLIGSSQIEHISKVLESDFEVIQGSLPTEKTIKSVFDLMSFFRKIDIVYWVFAPNNLKAFLLAKLFRTKIVLHWIGTDVFFATQDKDNYKRIAKAADLNLVCYDGLRKELNGIGIDALTVPIVPYNINLNSAKTPNHHKVLVYMPTNREDWYGYNTIMTVAKAFPDIEFLIVANSNHDLFSNKNITSLGHLSHEEMDKLYDQISIVLRCTKHDGYSMSIIEGLSKGKTVIWNHEHPFATYACSSKDIISAIHTITQNPPQFNKNGREYIKDTLSLNVIRDKTTKALQCI